MYDSNKVAFSLDGFQHGHAVATQHKIFGRSAFFQHCTATNRHTKDELDKEGKQIRVAGVIQ